MAIIAIPSGNDSRVAGVYGLIEAGGEFAQPDAELGNDEAQAEHHDAGPNPDEERPLVGQVIGRVRVGLRGLGIGFLRVGLRHI